jgi:hypothetical protein
MFKMEEIVIPIDVVAINYTVNTEWVIVFITLTCDNNVDLV